MANAPMAAVLRHIRRLTTRPADGQPADRQLLERFATHRDESAFTALLGRHGPMVLSVCLNILRDAHAAEDAFQATFLVLVRRAGSIQCGESVGGWLYQVARRAALRSRATATRLPDRDQRAEVMTSAEPWLDMSLRELREAVGEELGRLPDKYRTPLVLCYLEGKTQEEAAQLLGDSPGSVKGRLERGRKRLRERLARRGLALPAGLFVTALAQGATVPVGLAAATVKAALAAAGGQGLVGVSAEVAALVQGVSHAMTSKLTTVTVLICAAFGLAGALGYPAWAAWQGDPPAVKPAQGAKAAPQPAAEKGETLHYTGRVTDKETGKSIAGATVTVRRNLYQPAVNEYIRVLEVTRHVTDAQGKYSFTVPPEQTAKENLSIVLFIEHPDYVRFNSRNDLSAIRKNEKLGSRPSFEQVELVSGTPITGTVQTPEGQPAVGVYVTASYGADVSLDHTWTDAQGRFRFRMPQTTPGSTVVRLVPEQYAPSTHVVKNDMRGQLGTLTLQPGIRLRGKVLDVKGQPLAGVYVNALPPEPGLILTNRVAITGRTRSAVTDEKGQFEMKPLPPGKYELQPAVLPSGQWFAEDTVSAHPLTAAFVATKVTLNDGVEPEPVEIRATPQVVIEAQHCDSNGKPMHGPIVAVVGRMDNALWRSQGWGDADGKFVAYVPHGLEDVALVMQPDEQSALRWRKTKDGPLSNGGGVRLGTVTDDVKGIEVVRYAAPILLVKVSAQDGQPPKDPFVTAAYGAGKAPSGVVLFTRGRRTDVRFERQADSRFRTVSLLPDEETTVTAHADGYASQSVQVKLPEGETKEVEIVLEKAPPKKDEKK